MAHRFNFVKSVWQAFLASGGHDAQTLGGMTLANTANGQITATLPVTPQHLNRLGSVHGGLIATIIDVGGSLAISSKGYYTTGVSTDLNVSYIAGAKEGEELNILGKVDKMGKTLAFTSVEIRVGERLVAVGRHTKYVSPIHSNPQNDKDLLKLK
ncbi:uncharacterized protein VTP21DRAFT_9778 [Calcarisporiella thermophila]|uniref:uncharacterized protein n=1 Tax=Calcarisporiella thermophila TaxID=911321 RepID=UPI0037443B00